MKPPRGWAILAFFAWLVVLGAGAWLSNQPEPAAFILSWLHMLAIGLPILLLLHLGRRGLPSGSPQRVSGTFASGLVLGPAIILVAEIFLLIAGLLLLIVYLVSQPELLDQLSSLSDQFLRGELNPEQLQNLLSGSLSPGVMLAIIAFAGLAVPLIEEAFKPIGVWLLLLGRRRLSPAEGFSLGLVSGAGFALFESLLANAGVESWLAVVTARSGTAVVHLFTAGLVGWALAATWSNRHYLRLLGIYLLAVAIHGLWNTLTALTAFNQLGTLANFSLLGKLAPAILVFLATGCLFGLYAFNRKLRSVEPAPVTAPLASQAPPAGML
jgi:RsiW-degrading membrane proteinase PrsW (M82 family)